MSSFCYYTDSEAFHIFIDSNDSSDLILWITDITFAFTKEQLFTMLAK